MAVSRITRIKRYLRSSAGMGTTRKVAAGVVFAVGAYQSYWHIAEVTARAGEDAVVSHIIPLSIDGLMIVAARYISEARTRTGRVFAFVAFAAAMGATVTCNYLAAEPNPLSRAIAVWPALAVVCTAGLLHWGDMRPKTRRAASKPANVTPIRAARASRV
jgi:Protein of unknown function (DUF2637)